MDKATIQNYKELAANCTSRTNFARKYTREYIAIRRAGDEIAEIVFENLPRKVRKKYTFPELQKIALRYETRTQWEMEDGGSYHAALRMGVMDEIGPKTRKGKYKR